MPTPEAMGKMVCNATGNLCQLVSLVKFTANSRQKLTQEAWFVILVKPKSTHPANATELAPVSRVNHCQGHA
jgi:hypothetical protein